MPPTKKTTPLTSAPLAHIADSIFLIRGQKVIIDADLAALYGVSTKRLNEQVKRNSERFPHDFMFTLTAEEKAEVVANCDHLAKLKFSRTLPFAFTEHGAIQAANVLASAQAIEMGVYVVRAFVQLRTLLASNQEVMSKLIELSYKVSSHDQAIAGLINAISDLMNPPDPPLKQPVGFLSLHETSTKPKAVKGKK